MDTKERLETYAERHVSHGQAVRIFADIPPETAPQMHGWLTPAERRRMRRKNGSRKTHSHEGLLLTEVSEGNWRRSPCPKCSPVPRKLPRVGGTS